MRSSPSCIVFFFTDTAPPKIYTLSLHDALPISAPRLLLRHRHRASRGARFLARSPARRSTPLRRALRRSTRSSRRRSEEHTSELQSHSELVCRLLLEKKKSRGTGDSGARDLSRG